MNSQLNFRISIYTCLIRATMTASINQYFNASVSMQVNGFALEHI